MKGMADEERPGGEVGCGGRASNGAGAPKGLGGGTGGARDPGGWDGRAETGTGHERGDADTPELSTAVVTAGSSAVQWKGCCVVAASAAAGRWEREAEAEAVDARGSKSSSKSSAGEVEKAAAAEGAGGAATGGGAGGLQSTHTNTQTQTPMCERCQVSTGCGKDVCSYFRSKMGASTAPIAWF